MAGWTSLRELVRAEFQQSKEEGRDATKLDALRPAFEAAGDDEAKLNDCLNQMLALPISPDFQFKEPTDLQEIRALRTDAVRSFPTPRDEEWLYDRMYGAWLGRCVGCALGKPVEAFMEANEHLSSKDRIKTYLTAISPSEWPLNNYFPDRSPAEDKTGKLGWNLASSREKIAYMESDDDIRYTVLGQLVLAQKGKSFTSRDVATAWLTHFPYRTVCTAETQCFRNLVSRYDFHHGKAVEIDWDWVSTYQNPYREWIGAQIRADSWGYGAPGNPELAADFAWRDARISHIKNGVYGEMFVAAMIGAAFAMDEPIKIVEAGLAEIPKTSRLHAEMKQTIAICARYQNDFACFEAVLDELYQLFGHYSPVHTNNNAALVVAALLLGGHDFEKVVTLAVMGGWDTDCNGATAGSIVGAMLGAKKLPSKWIKPLNDTLNSEVIGYHPIAISECAKRSVKIALA